MTPFLHSTILCKDWSAHSVIIIHIVVVLRKCKEHRWLVHNAVRTTLHDMFGPITLYSAIHRLMKISRRPAAKQESTKSCCNRSDINMDTQIVKRSTCRNSVCACAADGDQIPVWLQERSQPATSLNKPSDHTYIITCVYCSSHLSHWAAVKYKSCKQWQTVRRRTICASSKRVRYTTEASS